MKLKTKATTVQIGDYTIVVEYNRNRDVKKVISRDGEDITSLYNALADFRAQVRTAILLGDGIDRVRASRQQACVVLCGERFVCGYELTNMQPTITSIQHVDLPANLLPIIDSDSIADAEDVIHQQLLAKFRDQCDRITAARVRHHANALAELHEPVAAI